MLWSQPQRVLSTYIYIYMYIKNIVEGIVSRGRHTTIVVSARIPHRGTENPLGKAPTLTLGAQWVSILGSYGESLQGKFSPFNNCCPDRRAVREPWRSPQDPCPYKHTFVAQIRVLYYIKDPKRNPNFDNHPHILSLEWGSYTDTFGSEHIQWVI